MKLLLDTHILLWTLLGSDKLPTLAKSIILDPTNKLFYSVVSVWEIAIKHASHPQDVELTGAEFSFYCHTAGFQVLDVDEQAVLHSSRARDSSAISKSSAAACLLSTRMRLSQASAFPRRFIPPCHTSFRSMTA